MSLDVTSGSDASEIISGDQSGGANTSHTIDLAGLRRLLAAVPSRASFMDYRDAALVGNALGKQTDGARRKSFRYLRELYLFRPDLPLFRALRDLWEDDTTAQPLLAGLCALTRDSVFRASSAAIQKALPGTPIYSRDLAESVEEVFPGNYSESTLAKIGRNTYSSWEQTGHLGRGSDKRKVRKRAECRPANIAYALMLGHLQGVRGRALFDTPWCQFLDRPTSHLLDLAAAASQHGMLELRQAGGVVEVTFDLLLRPFQNNAQGQLL